jgi:hypothetical protein
MGFMLRHAREGFLKTEWFPTREAAEKARLGTCVPEFFIIVCDDCGRPASGPGKEVCCDAPGHGGCTSPENHTRSLDAPRAPV